MDVIVTHRTIDMSRRLSINLLFGFILFLMSCSTGALAFSAAVFSKSYIQTAEVRNWGSIARSDWLDIQTTGGVFNEGGALLSDGDLFMETGGTLTNQAAVAFVNNQGDLAATLEQLGSDASLQALLSSMLTAGLSAQFTEMTGLGADLPKDAPLTQRITQDIQQGIVELTVEAGVTSAVYGEDFGDAFVTSLRSKASEVLGEHVANGIGKAVANGKMDTAGQMIAHAALGCAMGSIASDDCASGTAGAVVGEAVGLLYKDNIDQWLEDAENGTFEAGEIINQLEKMKADGVNMAKLASGFAVALGGGDVNLAAMTGGNAAENNALVTISVIIIALELVDKAILAYEAAQLAEAVHSGDNERATELAKDLSISLGIELTAGQMIPGSAIAGMAAKYTKKLLKNKGLDDVADSFNEATKHWNTPNRSGKGLNVPENFVPVSAGNALDIVPTKYRGAVSRSFRGEPELIELSKPIIVFRHWGGKASEIGSPWFSPKPYTNPGNAQRYLALPNGNTAQKLTRFEIPAGTKILRGKVASQAGEIGFGENVVGGGIQIYIPDPSVAVPIQ